MAAVWAQPTYDCVQSSSILARHNKLCYSRGHRKRRVMMMPTSSRTGASLKGHEEVDGRQISCTRGREEWLTPSRSQPNGCAMETFCNRASHKIKRGRERQRETMRLVPTAKQSCDQLRAGALSASRHLVQQPRDIVTICRGTEPEGHDGLEMVEISERRWWRAGGEAGAVRRAESVSVPATGGTSKHCGRGC